jgi:probable biosynthetic protein (TIGR04098 family)
MLSKGLEQKTAAFKDDSSNRLYATFIRITYSCSQLQSFHENDTIDFNTSIERFGNAIYVSDISVRGEDTFVDAKLMTSFSAREGNDNSKIEKSSISEKINHINEIQSAPDFLNNYRLLRKNLIDKWIVGNYSFSLSTDVLFESKYFINPWYDINGVGLLYFAAYPIISDIALNKFFIEKLGNTDWIEKYSTVTRDINYFANCNVAETIIIRLDSFEIIEAGVIQISSSLYRQSDNVMLARVFTVKKAL